MTSLGHIVPAVSLITVVYIHVATDWADIFETPTIQEKTYLKPCCTPLHTVSRKHVVQPGNHSKTLGTGVSLNVPLDFVNEFWIIGENKLQ